MTSSCPMTNDKGVRTGEPCPPVGGYVEGPDLILSCNKETFGGCAGSRSCCQDGQLGVEGRLRA